VRFNFLSTLSRRSALKSLFVLPAGPTLFADRAGSTAVDQNRSFTITSTVERVVLDVSVKNSEGGYVTGLKESDFRVYENGREQPILSFSNVDTPVTVGLIIDDSGSMRNKRPAVVTAGLAFANESNQQDQFFVVNFNNYVSPGLPPGTDFSDNLHLLRSALYMGSPEGQTALYDAIAFGLAHLQKATNPKRTLVVVSDGGDNVSKASQSDIFALTRAAQATVYTVGLFGADDVDRNPGVLQKLARISGGEYFNPPLLADVIAAFHKIAKDIRNRYTILYAPDPKLDAEKVSRRSVRVSVSAPGYKKLIARTRTSYIFRSFSEMLAKTQNTSLMKKEDR
jgi:Ca-activated chloride channel family protein